MFTVKQLKAFVAVAELRSFAEACHVVHLSQPALSTTIKNLEQTVGGPLLIRTTRRLTLSPEGQTFLPIAKRLLADWDTAFNDLHNLFAKQRGKLTIAAMPSFATTQLPKALARFSHQYPNINVLIEDVVAEQVNERVRSGRAELGVAFKPDDLSELGFEPLMTDEFVAALPINHPLAQSQQVTWVELSQYPWLMLQQPSAIRALIEKTLASLELQPQIEMEAHHLATLAKLVSAGIGVSILPSLYAQQLTLQGAVCRPLSSPITNREIGILFRKNNPLSSAVNAMIEVLKQESKLDQNH